VAKWKGNIISFNPQATSGTAYTGKANGIWSCDIVGQLKQAGLWALGITPPSAPAITTATIGNTQISIIFTAPSTLNGSTITSYTVTSSGGQTASGSSSPIVITGLTNGTSYTFTVVANSASGSSISSESVSATPTSFTVPSVPTIGTATISSASSAMITFTAPSFNGGTVITSYTAVSSPGGITGTLSQAGSGTITVNGLAQLTTYTFTVYATNSVGNSSNSTATGSISMPAVDPYFSSVGLLLSGDGANGVNYFTDLSIGSKTVTTVGNTQVSTSVKKFGTGSIYFDGANDSLSISSSSIMSFSGDFTIECWINCIDYRTSQNWFYNYVFNSVDASGGNWTMPYINAAVQYNGTLGVGFYGSAGTTGFGTSAAISMNTWYHVALVRASGTLTCYLNGAPMPVTSGSAANNGNISQTGLIIGDSRWNTGSESWHGYIDDFRVTNGVARYTSNFTPSTTASPTQ
jgi:hypothetical protein